MLRNMVSGYTLMYGVLLESHHFKESYTMCHVSNTGSMVVVNVGWWSSTQCGGGVAMDTVVAVVVNNGMAVIREGWWWPSGVVG